MWYKGVGGHRMDAEWSRNDGEQNRIADLQARLELLETRMVQMETHMGEELASLYHAETLHGRLISTLTAAVRRMRQLVDRVYQMVQLKKDKFEPD
jgi:hypothetical protein